MFICTYIHIYREADRQTDRQTEEREILDMPGKIHYLLPGCGNMGKARTLYTNNHLTILRKTVSIRPWAISQLQRSVLQPPPPPRTTTMKETEKK